MNEENFSNDIFKVMHLKAAGIDIASGMHYVAVPPDRDSENVRKFGSFTSDLHEMASWLKSCRIDTVAMESTGVYWLQPYLVLEEYGLDVYLVNARQIKNVSGRKSDVKDCQWIQQLHHVISDITGKSGMLIVESILQGERDPEKLAGLADGRIKASREDIVKSLQGIWREDDLFELGQAFDLYHVFRSKISQCDARIEQVLKKIADNIRNDGDNSVSIAGNKPQGHKRKANGKNRFAFNATPHLNNCRSRFDRNLRHKRTDGYRDNRRNRYRHVEMGEPETFHLVAQPGAKHKDFWRQKIEKQTPAKQKQGRTDFSNGSIDP